MKVHFRWILVVGLLLGILLPIHVSDGQARSLAVSPILDTNWQYTASVMTSRRSYHTLSLLPDGTALAAGGYYHDTSDHYLSSSEIYTPLTNTWAATSSMSVPRRNHTATVLLDGRVLVTGGENGTGVLASAEIFDPFTKTWTATGSMSLARINHTATRLQDGRVLVVGGCATLGCFSGAEIYNPASGTWSSAGSLVGAREKHTATLLADGSVLVAGGFLSFGTTFEVGSYKTAYRYYPSTNTWEAAGTMAAATYGRSAHNAVLRRDGKVLVVGGYYRKNVLGTINSGYLSSTEVYDPTANSWSDLSRPISYPRQLMAAVLDANGNYILLGGDNGTPAWDVEYMDINDPADTWHPPADLSDYLNTARKNSAAVILPGGVILVAGGNSDDTAGVNTAETNRFSTGESVSSDIPNNPVVNGLFLSSATLLQNGDILITGGSDTYDNTDTPCSNLVYLWDHSAETITDVPPESNMNRARCGHTTTLLPDGRVVVLGGRISTLGSSAGSGEIYNGGQWSNLPSGPELPDLESVLLPNGTIFIMQAGSGHSYIFDPGNLTFRETLGQAAGMYSGFTATLMKNGKVLIVGSLTSSVAEVFDPQSETFTMIAATPVNKIAHTATLLPDGKVMIAGGRINSGQRQNSVHLYDPVANNWIAVGLMSTARQFHSAVLLPDGRPVVLGGQSGTADAITTVEIFDPLTKTWSAAGNLLFPRFAHQTLLSLSGKLVTIGGADAVSDPYDTTEMFAFENIPIIYQPWRPTVTKAACIQCTAVKQVEVTGSNFTAAWEGSSGATAQSAANQPLVQLIRLDNQQIEWLRPGEASSDTRFLSAPITNFPDGPVMVFVYVNGSFQGKVAFLGKTGRTLYLPVVVR